jgi:hypothetical protein
MFLQLFATKRRTGFVAGDCCCFITRAVQELAELRHRYRDMALMPEARKISKIGKTVAASAGKML